jgi:2',3'-cyclic-nucleotide 2'-phosphodiesterase (5'-nucleotidase family)
MTIQNIFGIYSIFIFLFSTQAFAVTSRVSILHTNDLHSHFRGEKTPLELGGVARLKTAINKIREEVPHAFLVDAGDWSEGSIYYNESAGVESLQMMDRLGYDVAVVGNHDWLNGPDTLLAILKKVKPKTQFISYNLWTENYSRKEEFRKWIPPYVIREAAGFKIAFIGLSTYEFIFDKFFSPISVTEPFLKTRELAARLKEEGEADFVVAISHNTQLINQGILKAAPSVDLVISGHQHKKLVKPIEVSRGGYPSAWVVETGCWGRYLGRVDLKVEEGKLKLDRYQLIQIDSSIPENAQVKAAVEELEERLEKQYGPVFHDTIAESRLEVTREGVNSDMGNLVTDAYRKATQADFAVDSVRFIYTGLHPGVIRTSDVMNAIPAIYNPKTNRSWHLKVLPISGRALKWLLYTLHTSKKVSDLGLLNFSGVSYVYDPLFLQANSAIAIDLNKDLMPSVSSRNPTIMSLPVVKDIRIQGQPLDPDKMYRMALGNGLVEAIDFMNKNIYHGIPLDFLQDTGQESWRILSNYVQSLSPLTSEKIQRENRIRTLQPDLGVYADDVQWFPIRKTNQGILARIQVKVKNYGATSSVEKAEELPPLDPGDPFVGESESYPETPRQPFQLHLLVNQNGIDEAVHPHFEEAGSVQTVTSLKPGESATYTWEAEIPKAAGFYPITVRVEGDYYEINQTNNEVTRWFVEE